MTLSLDISMIKAAAERIHSDVVRTPTIRYRLHKNCELFLKAENLQPIGAFKIRGAFNMMRTLPMDCVGVVAHSSGNHAQAVAAAAKSLGIPATIVMPSNAPKLKKSRTEAAGANVITVGPDSEERKQMAAQLAEEQGLTPIPPYDHPLVAAGQGTAALELHEDAPALDSFYAPVSGGGLMAGCATALKNLSPETTLVGVEPEEANDTYLSLKHGDRMCISPPETIADGLRVRVPGQFTWSVLQSTLDRVDLVSDEEMLRVMGWACSHLRIVLEPSGAASLAAAMKNGVGRVGVLLSGGNVESEMLRQAISLYEQRGGLVENRSSD